MTIDEAIKHCEDKSRDESICVGCRADHKQLAGWLKELKKLRKKCDDLQGRLNFSENWHKFEHAVLASLAQNSRKKK